MGSPSCCCPTMTPEEIPALFANAAAAIANAAVAIANAVAVMPPLPGQPTNNDLTALHEVLHPLLLGIPYDEDGAHNLIGIIEPFAIYTETWGAPFPMLVQPPAYPAMADNAQPGGTESIA